MEKKLNKQIEDKMTKEEIDNLISLHINRGIDAIIEEISEIDNIPAEDVIKTHKIAIKKGLFVARKEL